MDMYVEKFPVTTWAGAFSPAYPYGQTMVAEINGSPTALTHGFPIELVVEYLRKSGFEIHP
ncbi:hypothetical protein KGQ24_01305, partial [Patescibacteria group bacterium]|nr:hypothetical protein [Patescibacteria group bacterium]